MAKKVMVMDVFIRLAKTSGEHLFKLVWMKTKNQSANNLLQKQKKKLKRS